MSRTLRDLDDKLVVITGAAHGIGRALAQAAAERGARLVLLDRDPEVLEVTHRFAGGGKAEGHVLDVADSAAYLARMDDIVDRLGTPDLLLNNAGLALLGEVAHMDSETWRQLLDVNLRGVVHGIHAIYPRMVARGQGHICNIACIAGLLPVPLATAYSTTKHALVGLSTSLRAEAADRGVGISVVCPGAVGTRLIENLDTVGVDKGKLTALIPTRQLLAPARCARAILNGIAKNRAIITVTLHARFSWLWYRLLPASYQGLSQISLGGVRRWLQEDTQDES